MWCHTAAPRVMAVPRVNKDGSRPPWPPTVRMAAIEAAAATVVVAAAPHGTRRQTPRESPSRSAARADDAGEEARAGASGCGARWCRAGTAVARRRRASSVSTWARMVVSDVEAEKEGAEGEGEVSTKVGARDEVQTGGLAEGGGIGLTTSERMKKTTQIESTKHG